jgi:hypothetical protein
MLVPSAWSLVVHAMLLALVASVTWQVASPRRAPTEAALFDDPGAIEPATTLGALPEPGDIPAPAQVAPAPTPIEVAPRPRGNASELLSSPSRAAAPVPRISLVEPAPSGVRYASMRADRAGRVVFLVDASGAMTTSLSFVLEELQRSVARLAPSQRFGVVVFRERPATSGRASEAFEAFRMGDATMHAPTPATRRALAEWISALRPEGRSTPMEGLRAALAMKPDAVFLLARSIPRSGAEPAWGPGISAILAELDRLNPVDDRTGLRRTTIKAIQFIDEDPTGTMQAIARAHGNAPESYRVMTIDALGRDAAEAGAAEQAVTEAPPTLRRADAALAELAQRGLDIRAMFGILLPNERDDVRARATEAAELLRTTPPAEGYEDANTLLLARADLLLALCDHRAIDLSALTRVRASLEAMSPATPRGDPARSSMIAIAAQRDADALARIADARTALRAWEESSGSEDVAERGSIEVEIALASLAHRTTSDADRLAAQLRESSAVSSVVLATAMTRAMLLRSEAPERALRPIISLAGDASVGNTPEVRESVTSALLAEAIDPTWPPERLPREAMLALASRLESERPDEAARVLLLAHDTNPSARAAAELLWRAASLLERGANNDESRLAAARVLARIAIEHPGDARAEEAVNAAASRLAPLATNESTRDAAVQASARAVLANLLDETIGRSAPKPSADLMLLRVELLLDDDTAESRARAAAMLRTLPTRHDPDEHAPRVLWLASRACESPTTNAIDKARLWADITTVWDKDRSGIARYELARTLLDANDARGALSEVRAAMQDPRLAPTADARLLLAECQIASNDPAGAMSTLRALAPALDPHAGDLSARDAYWRCWTLMLEVLAREPTSARRDAITAHVARLRSIDPDLGGEPWRSRILAALPG